MSNSQLRAFADRELRDLSAKLRFALVSVVILPPVAATLTTLGVPRPVAAVTVFAGLALFLLAFVVARISENAHVTPEEYERQKIAEILAGLSSGPAMVHPIPSWEGRILRVTGRLAQLFSNKPVSGSSRAAVAQ
ncbi:MAG: hypothetical protein HY047_08660 [Acidobacteria bacterium]|nr:hypothetical protein [Acidobacteriota bacterium]